MWLRLTLLREDELHYGTGGLEGEGTGLGRGRVELAGDLRGAAEEGGGRARGRGPGVDVVERSDGRRGRRRREGRPHDLVLVEGVAQQGEDVGSEGAEGGEKIESSSFILR